MRSQEIISVVEIVGNVASMFFYFNILTDWKVKLHDVIELVGKGMSK